MPAVLIIGIGVILTAFVAYAMANLQHSSSQGFVGWLAQLLVKVPIVGGFSAEQVLKMDAWITHYIGGHFSAVESHAVGWLGGMRQYVKLMAEATIAPALSLYVFGQWLLSVAIPDRIQAKTGPLEAQVKAAHAEGLAALAEANAVAKAHPGAVPVKTVTQIRNVAMPHAEEWGWIHDNFDGLKKAVQDAAVAPVPAVLPKVRPVAWPVGLTPTSIRRRLHRVEGYVGATALAAALAGLFGVSRSCIRPGGNLGRFLRSVCGAPSWLIRFLVAGAIEAFVLADLCDFSDLLIKQTETLRPSLMKLVNVENALVGCHDFDAPMSLNLPPISLPALVDAVSFAA